MQFYAASRSRTKSSSRSITPGTCRRLFKIGADPLDLVDPRIASSLRTLDRFHRVIVFAVSERDSLHAFRGAASQHSGPSESPF